MQKKHPKNAGFSVYYLENAVEMRFLWDGSGSFFANGAKSFEKQSMKLMASSTRAGLSSLWRVVLVLAISIFGIDMVDGQDREATGSLPQSREALKVIPADERLVDHPLQSALQIAEQTAQLIDREVKDYTCHLVMRERIRGRLGQMHFADMKVRVEEGDNVDGIKPFSVYLHFVAPPNVQDREVLYVHKKNDGEMIAKNGGQSNLKEVTLALKPDSKRAMRGRHYPITEIGMANIIQRLIEETKVSMNVDIDRRECQVQIIDNARIEGRSCRCVQVVFPEKREHLKFHLVRVFLDSETGLPIRFAAYSWPKEPGGSPRLIEEYTFLNLQINVGLSEADFDRDNPAYDFYSAKDSQDEAAE